MIHVAVKNANYFTRTSFLRLSISGLVACVFDVIFVSSTMIWSGVSTVVAALNLTMQYQYHCVVVL